MIDRVTFSRMGPLSRALRIKPGLDFKQELARQVRAEVTKHYRHHAQQVYSTYIFMEGEYIGCMRYSDSGEEKFVSLKMYTNQFDGTRDIMNRVNSALGRTVIPRYYIGNPDFTDLDTIVEEWIDSQFAFNYRVESLPGNATIRHQPVTVTHLVDTAAADAIRFVSMNTVGKDQAGVVYFKDETGDIFARAIVETDGSGQVQRLISTKDIVTWRKIFQWSIPGNPALYDQTRSAVVLDDIFRGVSKFEMVWVFPADLETLEK